MAERSAAAVVLVEKSEHLVKALTETTWYVDRLPVSRWNHPKHGDPRGFSVLAGSDFEMIHLMPSRFCTR